MSEDCAGNHMCEPPAYPTGLGESWTCDECGKGYTSFRVHDRADRLHLTPSMLARIPESTHGWTSS